MKAVMTSSFTKLTLLVVFVALFSGCISMSQPKSVRLDDIDNGTPLHIVSVVAQQGALADEAPKSKGWFASISSKKSSKARADSLDAVPPPSDLDQALSGTDLGQIMVYELNAAFRKGKPFDVQNIHGTNKPVHNIREHLENIPENSLLVLNTRYHLAGGGDVLVVEADASLYVRTLDQKTGEFRSRSKPVYVNRIVSQLDLTQTPESQRQKAVDESMRLGLREIAYLVAADLSAAQHWVAQSERQTWTAADTGKKLKGVQVQKADNRITIRLKNGELISLPKEPS